MKDCFKKIVQFVLLIDEDLTWNKFEKFCLEVKQQQQNKLPEWANCSPEIPENLKNDIISHLKKNRTNNIPFKNVLLKNNDIIL